MLSLFEIGSLLAVCVPSALLWRSIHDEAVRGLLAVAGGFAFLSFLATLCLVPLFAPYLSRRGLKGRDMGRRGTPQEAVEM